MKSTAHIFLAHVRKSPALKNFTAFVVFARPSSINTRRYSNSYSNPDTISSK